MGIMLQVDNLSACITEEDLIVRFGEYGIVESATMGPASSTASEKRSACVVMANSDEAQAAIDWLHDTRLAGRTISVARAWNDGARTVWLHLVVPS